MGGLGFQVTTDRKHNVKAHSISPSLIFKRFPFLSHSVIYKKCQWPDLSLPTDDHKTLTER